MSLSRELNLSGLIFVSTEWWVWGWLASSGKSPLPSPHLAQAVWAPGHGLREGTLPQLEWQLTPQIGSRAPQLSGETKTNWFDLMLSHVERHESSALFPESIDFIKHCLLVLAKCNFLVSSSNCSTATDFFWGGGAGGQCHFVALICYFNLFFPIGLLH